MAQRDEIVNVLNSLDSLSAKTLNSLTDEELKKLREKLMETNTIVSTIIRGRTHCKHYLYPENNK